MKIHHPEKIRAQSKTRIKKLLAACKRLKKSYESKKGLDNCPLCQVVMPVEREHYYHDFKKCNRCPWHTIKDGLVSDRRGACVAIRPEVEQTREHPASYVRQANYRIKELTFWIEVYEQELASR